MRISRREEYHVQTNAVCDPLFELQMISQSILGRSETRHGQDPHDGENITDQKLLLPDPRALDFRRDCHGLGVDDKGGSAV